MSTSQKKLLIVGGALLVYLVLAAMTASWLKLQGAPAWILRGSLALVGLAAAAAFLWFDRKIQKQRAPAGQGSTGGDSDIEWLFRQAETRLAAARVEGGGRLRSLPVVLIVGEAGSAKTSTAIHSGLDPELLAGQVHEDAKVVPTALANLWFTRRTVLLEAGGRLLTDAAQWKQVLRRVAPARLGNLSSAGGAPRAALVCFDTEQFLRPGASESAAAAARNLHSRLAEISQALGIPLPVYVLFTRADRVPFFADYMRNLSNDEAAQPVGATLALDAGAVEGAWAERETARLNGAFDELYRSLASRRTDLLARENDPARLPGTYEFPREFRKLRGLVVRFLLEICRPSQLTIGPFLRGFYFSGVRPVVIRDMTPAPAAPAARGRHSYDPASGATGMFQGGIQAAEPVAQAAAPQAAVTRKVPQWMFLGRLFAEVLLADRIAMGASGASTKTAFFRRVLFIGTMALCLILGIGFLVSWANNRALESQAVSAARGISATESNGVALAGADALRKLETLRQSLATLTTYRREGPPWSYRWGLYTGETLYPHVYRVYYQKFHQLLFGQAQTRLLDFLRGLPATPGPDYGPTYDALKGYLITTSHHEKSTQMFLSPLLYARWSAGREVDPERRELAQKQFDFYSEELKTANPFSSENDSATVTRARRYLSQFAGVERVYQAMLADAGKMNPGVNFNKRFPGSAETVLDSYEVAGPFTKSGWDFMKNAIKSPDRYFAGEQWVLGDQVAAAIDTSKLEQQLRERYFLDFITQWRAYLKNANVVKYASLQDASKKLNALSGNQSPLLALLWLASQNTAVDEPTVANAFQPVQAVVPAANGDKFIAPSNQNYMSALLNLQASLDQVAAQPGQVNDAAAAQTMTQAGNARIVTRQLAQAFRPDPQARVDAIVEKLLEDPITHAEALLRTLGPADLNAKGRALCAQLRPLWSKYPFNANATTEATLAEFNSVFHKPDGALWAFYDANLQKLLVREGAQFVPAPNITLKLNPWFVDFFNRAARFAEALYPNNAAAPHFSYTLKPVPSEGIQSVGLQIDGQTLAYSGGTPAPKQFVWQGTGPHEAKATVKFGGGPDLAWSNNDGLWAVFHFFDKAERWQPAGSGYALEWVIRIGRDAVKLPNGNPLTVRFELDMAGGPAIFQKGFLSRLSCVSEVAR